MEVGIYEMTGDMFGNLPKQLKRMSTIVWWLSLGDIVRDTNYLHT